MRNLFRGYRKPTKTEFVDIWKEGIFTFDTSVLLDIYRYTPSTREDLFKTLEKLEGRIWLPYQVAFEYREQRENVIRQQYSISEYLDEINNSFKINFTDRFQKGHPFADIDKIGRIIEEAVEKSKNILQTAQSNYPNLLEEDTYLERILDLFDEKIGEPYSKERQHEIYQEGEERYKQKIPPGYEDNKRKEGMKPFGDLVLWYQIIDYANSHHKPVILVTSDAKEDWWRKNRNGSILGPRPEIIEEAYNKANFTFYMYLVDDFIKRAEQYIDIKVKPGTIQEIKDLREYEGQYEFSLHKIPEDDYRISIKDSDISYLIDEVSSTDALPQLAPDERSLIISISHKLLAPIEARQIALWAQGISPKTKTLEKVRIKAADKIYQIIIKVINEREKTLQTDNQEA